MHQRKKIVACIALAAAFAVADGYALQRVHARVVAAQMSLQKAAIAKSVRERAGGVISAETVAVYASPENRAAFESLYRALQEPRLVRFKVWSPDKVVVWSNLGEIIGQRYADNEGVEEAMADGEAVMEIEDADATESEHVAERSFAALAETYVPLKDADGKTFGIVELYEPAEIELGPARDATVRAALPIVGATVVFLAIAAAALFRKRK